MKPTPKDILKANRRALKSADPRSRDRLRYRVKVMEIAAQIAEFPSSHRVSANDNRN